MRRLTIGVLTCAMLATFAAVASSGPNEDYGFAVALYRKSRWDQAAQRFQAFLQQNPRHPRAENAQLYYGLTLINLNQQRQARDVLRDFVRRYPESKNLADAKYRIGEASYYLGDYKAAEEQLSEFLTAYPRHSLRQWALPYLGDARLRLGDPGKAEPIFQAALKQFPNSSLADESQFGLARALERLDRPKEAASAYTKLIQSGPGPYLDDALVSLGSIRFEQDDFAAAAEFFDRAAKLEPPGKVTTTARLNAGFAFYRQGQFDEAIKRFAQVEDKSPEFPTARYWTALSLEKQEKPEAAAEIYRTIASSEGDKELRAESLYRLGEIEYRASRYAEASQAFEQSFKLVADGPRTEESTFFAAQAAFFAGELERANSIASAYAEKFPEGSLSQENQILTARLLEASIESKDGDLSATQRQELGRAINRYTVVTKSDAKMPTRMKAHYYRAALAERLGNSDVAAESAEQIRAAYASAEPDQQASLRAFTESFVFAARALVAEKDWNRADQLADAYLSLSGNSPLDDAALAARAISRMASGRVDDAMLDWNRLRDDYPKSKLLPGVTSDLAERAYASKSYAEAAELFGVAADLADEEAKAGLLSGAGWAMFEARKYADAATRFEAAVQAAQLQPAVAVESAYMAARSLEEAGKPDEARQAYKKAFANYRPEKPAPAEFEQDTALRNVYLSGLQLARNLRTAGKLEDASEAYKDVLDAFPEPRNLDRLLDEWALLHYEAGDYDRADELFVRLIAARPNSPVADNARLSLAESEIAAGRLDKASEMLSELATSAKSDADVKRRSLALMVGIAGQSNDWESVKKSGTEYLQAFPNAPDRPAIGYQLAEALIQLEEFDAARPILKTVRETPESDAARESEWFPRTWVLSAEVERQKGDVAAVKSYVEELRAFDPVPKIVYQADQLLGQALLKKAKFDEARGSFQKVLDNPDAKLTATAARAQYGIAQSYFLQEKWQAAWDAAFRAYSIYEVPDVQAPALLMAARCDEALGNTAEAREFYASVAEEFPSTVFAEQASKRLKELNDGSSN
ncbi:tol-pal system protein YbgF [Stratiformator vulcanicus]|uniref:Tol-pal system protein YbgF n=2 Tax=Stratiformator vulcanicus TaxID=2527980 RepID=A0A517R4D7_9PLAN|nr:tol-pal system protein YbgF [Stratiformator vulcanicus]